MTAEQSNKNIENNLVEFCVNLTMFDETMNDLLMKLIKLLLINYFKDSTPL